MTWFKVDDSFWGHPKRMRCNPTAVGVWVLAGSWSAQQLTDGRIDRHVLPILGGRPSDANQLVESGLWESTDTGWQFHDWADWQPTRAQVHERRETELARKKAWRDKRAEERRRDAGQPQDETRDTTVSETDADAERLSTRPDPSRPVPSRPVPTRPDPKTPSESSGTSSNELAAQARGKRINEDWKPSDGDVAWARSEGYDDFTQRRETEKFVDHFLAASGQNAKKVDWSRAWKNWLRNVKPAQRPTGTDEGMPW